MRSGGLSLTIASSPEAGRRRRRFWLALGAVLVAALAALVEITTTGPRVAVRWSTDVDESHRLALEQRYELRNGRRDNGPEWRYELGDWSRENIAALVRDPAVADTGYIDRVASSAERPDVRIGIRSLPFPFGPDVRQLLQPQSLLLLLAGGSLLAFARIERAHIRRLASVAMLLIAGVMLYACPIAPALVEMGDADTYTSSREAFEAYAGVSQIRFEAHLSHAILGRIYALVGLAADSPGRALSLLMRGATAWFVLCALAIGFVERWSPIVVRYLGLALLAPSALLYFGYRELGYLSLNVAAFPLLARGLRSGGARLESGTALFGLGAALHGFGLLSLAGSWIAAFGIRARLADRVRLALRVTAWGTAAYLGWIAVYVIVMKLPVIAGHADSVPWRPWLVDQVVMQENRVNVAILSVVGARDLLFTGWVVGAPLLAVAASLWRQHQHEVRVALLYAVPSTMFTILFWPIQGIGVEMDLVVAAFPAVYALAWVAAHDPRRTLIAAALLASGHIAFWRIVLDPRFVN
jgi:hypothetical protein